MVHGKACSALSYRLGHFCSSQFLILRYPDLVQSSAAFIFDSNLRAQLPALDKMALLSFMLEGCRQMLNILQTSGHELPLPKQKKKAHRGNLVTINQLEGGLLKILRLFLFLLCTIHSSTLKQIHETIQERQL